MIAKQQIAIMETPIKCKDNHWKTKAIERGKKLNRAKQEIKRQKKRAERWCIKYYEYRRPQELTTVKHHRFSL